MKSRALLGLVPLLLLPTGNSEAAPQEPLRVAVREAAPFSMRDPSGKWTGLSVDLWEDIAKAEGFEFRWRELPLADTFPALEAGSVDVAITALTVTTEREKKADFSHPYLVSGLILAYPARGAGWMDTLRGFVSLDFLSAVASLAVLLLAVGVAVWLFERRKNPEQFGGDPIRGLGSGFWWSAVTMTTVGYGDKAPRTLGGRLVGLVWMFASLIVIASFTASIAASVTVSRLGSDLLRGRSLDQLEMGVVTGSAAAARAESMGYRTKSFLSVDDAVRAMGEGRVDVVLHDEPILRYLQRTGEADIELAPHSLVRDDYGFGLREGSRLREPINRALLRILHEPAWQEIRRRYLGAQGEGA